jgi:hypothetical protein
MEIGPPNTKSITPMKEIIAILISRVALIKLCFLLPLEEDTKFNTEEFTPRSNKSATKSENVSAVTKIPSCEGDRFPDKRKVSKKPKIADITTLEKDMIESLEVLENNSFFK